MHPNNTQKKKIIHIIQSLGNGGCENMLLRTLPLMSDFEHQIITLKELGELAPKFTSSGIPVTTIHCNGIFDIFGILRLRKLVREKNPNIIITYLFHADMIGRLFLARCHPKLSSCHSESPLCHSELVEESQPSQRTTKSIPIIPFLRTTYNHPKYLIARILEWFTKPLVNHYLANSEAVKDFYVKYIGVTPEKIAVIPNGIDTEYFNSITPDPELRKSLGINSDDFVVICVANLHPNKGHQYLLEAFEMCHPGLADCHPGLDPGSNSPSLVIPSKVEESQYNTYPSLKLLLVGDGTKKENLLHQIKNYRSKKNILFLGKRNDVPQLLKISNLFILPTLFEGMSNAIMEAMASGLPIITTDIPENKILIQNKQTGHLVPMHSSENIKRLILEIINNKTHAQEIGLAAKEFASKYFSLQKNTESLKTFLDTL